MLSLNDVALKAQADGGADLKAQDVEDTLRAICAHRASAPVTEPFQPVRQLAA
jgi:hypothetical protein